MNFQDLILISLRAIASNGLRSLLTTLGIIIGVSSVIILMSVGQGAVKGVIDELNALGTNLIFIEPLGTNPFINLYRKLTPKSRSRDEHPLIHKDFKYIKNKFIDTKIKYYGFLTLIFSPFYKLPNESKFFKLLAYFDQILFKLKIFRIFAWSVLITAKKN